MIDLYCQVKYVRGVSGHDSNNKNRTIEMGEECYSLHVLERQNDGQLIWHWAGKDSMEPFKGAIFLEPDDRHFWDKTFPFKESDLLCE